MSGFELGKIAASILVAGLIALGASEITGILYHTEYNPQNRGYKIEAFNMALSNNKAQEAETKIDLIDLLANADIEKGNKLTKKCSMCHSFNKGGPQKLGPNLWSIVNSKKGNKESFTYSKALKDKGGDWTDDELYHMINKPKDFIPGTKMSFVGLKKPQEVADVIAYLKTLSD